MTASACKNKINKNTVSLTLNNNNNNNNNEPQQHSWAEQKKREHEISFKDVATPDVNH